MNKILIPRILNSLWAVDTSKFVENYTIEWIQEREITTTNCMESNFDVDVFKAIHFMWTFKQTQNPNEFYIICSHIQKALPKLSLQ